MLATRTSSALRREWMKGIESRCPRDRMRAARDGAVRISELEMRPGRLRAWADGFEVVIECRPVDAAVARRLRMEGDALSAAAFDLLRPIGSDLRARCSCPDWSPMCVHAAAAYFAFLDHAHQDPRAMLDLRGVAAEAVEPVFDACVAGEAEPVFAGAQVVDAAAVTDEAEAAAAGLAGVADNTESLFVADAGRVAGGAGVAAVANNHAGTAAIAVAADGVRCADAAATENVFEASDDGFTGDTETAFASDVTGSVGVADHAVGTAYGGGSAGIADGADRLFVPDGAGSAAVPEPGETAGRADTAEGEASPSVREAAVAELVLDGTGAEIVDAAAEEQPLAAFWQGTPLPEMPHFGDTRSAMDVIGAPPWVRAPDDALATLFSQVMEHGRARLAQADLRSRALARALQVRSGAAALWVPAPPAAPRSGSTNTDSVQVVASGKSLPAASHDSAATALGAGSDKSAGAQTPRSAGASSHATAAGVDASSLSRGGPVPSAAAGARSNGSAGSAGAVSDAPLPRRRGRPPKRLVDGAAGAAIASPTGPHPALAAPASTRTPSPSLSREPAAPPLRLSASQRKGMKVARTVPLSEVVYAVATGVDVQVARLELAELQRAGLLVARGRGTQRRFVPAPG